MEVNQQEAAALKAKKNAERRFSMKDFVGARKYALKAQTLFPELDGISQMVATLEVYIASESKVNGEIDFYAILGLKPSADRTIVKKQYKKLAVLLHPDKNKSVGADGAFKLVSEAWTLLSDDVKRASYDLKTTSHLSSHIVTFSDNCSSLVPPTFWTVCTSCQVQYEYLRKYVNKRLACKNCHGTFIAVELGVAPHGASYPVCAWSHLPEKGHGGGHGYGATTFVTTNGMLVTGNGVPGYHSGHGSEYVSNVSYQWNTYPGTSAGYVDHNGLVPCADSIYPPADGYLCKPLPGTDDLKVGITTAGRLKTVAIDTNANGLNGYHESGTKSTRPYKRRKVEFAGGFPNSIEKVSLESAVANGNGTSSSSTTMSPKFSSPVVAAFEPRNLLIERARTEIREKLGEIRLAAENNTKLRDSKFGGRRKGNLGGCLHLQPKKRGPVTLTVPDSDFHDFDRDRSEECFKPKQIWALYDEEDGMPRLYCLIREVISVKPLKIQVSYLSSKTDAEFGLVNWINSGFTKSCGGFRAGSNSDVIEQVNMFSHLLSREKVGRGGCVRIYPRRGDIWAVYRNWSPRWNRTTSDEVRHQYEMVEVLDDYSEELGVRVIPLVKLDGYKTVYRRNSNKDSIRWTPRREMVRFSHLVPSWYLKEVSSLPEDCWDLDPAATPDELLQAEAVEPCQAGT
ncbi:hypothetical protein Dimus_009765 [Dionaea muscipula]